MANITKRIGKNGALSYRIRAYAGTAADGRQIVRSMTFTPPAGMSARQAEKEANRQAVEFEQMVQRGIVLDAKFTLDELLDKWFQEFARPQLKPQTVYGYQNLRVRISAALGHMKIDSIRPAHLMAFYDNLAESGMRMDVKFTAAPALISAVEKMKRGDLAKAAGVSSDTVRIALRGDRVSRGSAEKLAAAAGLPLTKYAARVAARLHIWTAAPAPPRLFLPQAAAQLRSQQQLPVSSTGCGRRRCLCLLFFQKSKRNKLPPLGCPENRLDLLAPGRVGGTLVAVDDQVGLHQQLHQRAPGPAVFVVMEHQLQHLGQKVRRVPRLFQELRRQGRGGLLLLGLGGLQAPVLAVLDGDVVEDGPRPQHRLLVLVQFRLPGQHPGQGVYL